jgi:hypothetical protein
MNGFVLIEKIDKSILKIFSKVRANLLQVRVNLLLYSSITYINIFSMNIKSFFFYMPEIISGILCYTP